MTERDAGYLLALQDAQTEVRKTAQDPSTSSEGRLELLGVLSLLSELVDARLRSYLASDAVVEKDFWEREF